MLKNQIFLFNSVKNRLLIATPVLGFAFLHVWFTGIALIWILLVVMGLREQEFSCSDNENSFLFWCLLLWNIHSWKTSIFFSSKFPWSWLHRVSCFWSVFYTVFRFWVSLFGPSPFAWPQLAVIEMRSDSGSWIIEFSFISFLNTFSFFLLIYSPEKLAFQEALLRLWSQSHL